MNSGKEGNNIGWPVWGRCHGGSSSWTGCWTVEGISLGRNQDGVRGRETARAKAWLLEKALPGGRTQWDRSGRKGSASKYQYWWSQKALDLTLRSAEGIAVSSWTRSNKWKQALELSYTKCGLETPSISFTPPGSFVRKAQPQSQPRPTESELHWN